MNMTLFHPCLFRSAAAMVVVSMVAAAAQSPVERSVPTGLLVKAAPSFAEWEITHSYPQDSPAAKPAERKDSIYLRQPRKSLVTKTRSVLKESIVRVNGEKVDRWQIDKTVYIFAPEAGFWAMFNSEFRRNNPSAEPEKLPLPDSGFVGLDWITPETYAGSFEQGGRSVLVFVPSGAGRPDLSSPEGVAKAPTIALIDGDTRLPVMIKKDGVRRDFMFRSPPGEMLALPPDLAADLKRAADIEANANRAPGREY